MSSSAEIMMDRRHGVVVEELQLLRQHVAVERLVVDDQDASWRRHLGPLTPHG
jgi:hypothetical protein